MWEKLKRPGHFIVLEQGAGRGHLAEVYDHGRKKKPLSFTMFWIIEPKIFVGVRSLRYQLQSQPFRGDRYKGGGKPRPYYTRMKMPISQDNIEEAKPEYSRGDPRGRPVRPSVVLSNELVDAFPVHIVEKRGERLYEVFVDVQQDGRFCEVLDEPRQS